MTTHPSRASGKERTMRHRARVNVRVLIAAALTGVMLVPAVAHASKTFVPRIKLEWGINSLPVKGEGCMICHQNDNGKSGTIDKPFGKTMQAHGVKGARVDLLVKALGVVATAKPVIDSDGDKVGDYVEIAKDHTDPNNPKSFVFVPPPPPPMGGEGGQAGESAGGVSNGEGGTGEFEPSGPAPYTPPSALDVPPPFEHGCGMAPRSSAPSVGLFAALAALTLAARGLRRRARRSAPPHC